MVSIKQLRNLVRGKRTHKKNSAFTKDVNKIEKGQRTFSQPQVNYVKRLNQRLEKAELQKFKEAGKYKDKSDKLKEESELYYARAEATAEEYLAINREKKKVENFLGNLKKVR